MILLAFVAIPHLLQNMNAHLLGLSGVREYETLEVIHRVPLISDRLRFTGAARHVLACGNRVRVASC